VTLALSWPAAFLLSIIVLVVGILIFTALILYLGRDSFRSAQRR
jgi:hypothetical protein